MYLNLTFGTYAKGSSLATYCRKIAYMSTHQRPSRFSLKFDYSNELLILLTWLLGYREDRVQGKLWDNGYKASLLEKGSL